MQSKPRIQDSISEDGGGIQGLISEDWGTICGDDETVDNIRGKLITQQGATNSTFAGN